MKNLKIILIATTIAILAVATVGAALAHTYRSTSYYGGMMGYSTPNIDDDCWTEMREHIEDHLNEIGDEDWWTEMREHMDDHWDEIRDEEWYSDMRTYMDEHLDEVQSQDWFDEMLGFMEDQRNEYGYRYDNYPRSYGRGCWGW